MTAIQLKSSINKLVADIHNEQLLQTAYEFLKSSERKKSKLWDSLTNELKQEVMFVYEESEDENNLLDSDKVMKKFKCNFSGRSGLRKISAASLNIA